jgi:hypothetical protein
MNPSPYPHHRRKGRGAHRHAVREISRERAGFEKFTNLKDYGESFMCEETKQAGFLSSRLNRIRPSR